VSLVPLISAKYLQVKQQVTITKASYRTFGPDNWHLLLKQLAAWKVPPPLPSPASTSCCSNLEAKNPRNS